MLTPEELEEFNRLCDKYDVDKGPSFWVAQNTAKPGEMLTVKQVLIKTPLDPKERRTTLCILRSCEKT